MSAWCSLHSHSLVKLKTSGCTSMELLACVPGAWKEWAKERAGAREGDARVFFSRARFSCAHYFQAPATQAMKPSDLSNLEERKRKANIFLLVILSTAPSRQKRRAAIRETWWNKCHSDGKVNYYICLGSLSEPSSFICWCPVVYS